MRRTLGRLLVDGLVGIVDWRIGWEEGLVDQMRMLEK